MVPFSHQEAYKISWWTARRSTWGCPPCSKNTSLLPSPKSQNQVHHGEHHLFCFFPDLELFLIHVLGFPLSTPVQYFTKSWVQSYHCCSPPHVPWLLSLWRLSLLMLRWCCWLLLTAVVSLQGTGTGILTLALTAAPPCVTHTGPEALSSEKKGAKDKINLLEAAWQYCCWGGWIIHKRVIEILKTGLVIKSFFTWYFFRTSVYCTATCLVWAVNCRVVSRKKCAVCGWHF